MKFVLFVEGRTEKVVPEFLKRWLDPQLSRPVGIQAVVFQGWPQLWSETPGKTKMYLDESSRADDVIAVISLMDLYGPSFYPPDKLTASDRYEWAKDESENRVNRSKFRQFFAVHEIEAWLLSNPDIFPTGIKSSLNTHARLPETVNLDRPPAKLLDELYRTRLKRTYMKVTDGSELFQKLDPAVAYNKCPYLKALLDEMLQLARDAGL